MEVIMKKILSLSAFLAIALFIGAACQTASTTTTSTATTTSTDNSNNAKNTSNTVAPKTDEHGHADDAPRIMLEAAKKEFDADNAIFVDTRAKSAYDAEHIKGAINMTTSEVEARWKELQTGKKIIAYCS
jgi:hypothetical protein